MPTPARPFRRLGILSGVSKILVGVVLLSLPLWMEVDETGLWIGLGLSAFVILVGLYDLRKARRIDPDETFLTLDDLPLADQAAHVRRVMLIVGVLMPLVAAHHAFELYRLETGAVESVRLVVPVGFVYETLGFWPAVFVLPVLTVAGLAAMAVRLRRIRRRLAEAGDADDLDDFDDLADP
jgi:hypothetical protein